MDPYAQLAERVAPGATLVRHWPLRGGVSAHVLALEVALPDGALRRVVLRRHGAAGWKASGPDVTANEFDLLKALARAGMAVPQPLFLETSSERFGSPFFVMEFVEGTTELDADALPAALPQMAEYLLHLHALRLDVPALPACENPALGALSFLVPADPLTATLEELAARVPVNEPAPLHGDFWPGNILWREGRIAAVIDWEDAALGDPLSDLAGCRIELLWKYGQHAADAFTGHYLSGPRIDHADLPVWNRTDDLTRVERSDAAPHSRNRRPDSG